MKLSVIIPAYNEEKYIADTLSKVKQAIQENNIDNNDWELIVCDNNSVDKTVQIAQQYGAILIHEPINQISRARNTGASIAKGHWLLFIDADTYPNASLMQEVFTIINDNSYIGCGATVKVEGGTFFNRARMERLNPLLRLLKICGGAFLLCKADAFRTIDGFSLTLYAYEEIDLIKRLKKHGKTVNKKFTILHKNPIITSGRKGDYTLPSMITLLVSNAVAPLLYLFRKFLPKKVIHLISKKMLGYWYTDSR